MNSLMTRVLNRIKILALLLLASSQCLFACDVCGCFMGLTPYDNQSNIGLVYRLRTFSGYYGFDRNSTLLPSGSLRTGNIAMHTDHQHDEVPNGNDYEEYRVLELRSKFFLHQRIEMNIIVPFHFNSMIMNETSHKVSGLGDVNIFSGYQLLRKMDMEGWQYRLTLGAGIKLPTGRDDCTDEKNERIHLMMQPGTGTTDYFFYGNYTAAINRWGASLTGSFKLNGTNSYNEKISNSVNSYGSIFYKTYPGKWIIIPSAQLYYENTAGIRTVEGISPMTSMNVLMAGPGVDVYLNNLQFNLSGLLPVAEEKITGKAASAFKFSAGFIYNFNQRNYPIKKRQQSAE